MSLWVNKSPADRGRALAEWFCWSVLGLIMHLKVSLKISGSSLGLTWGTWLYSTGFSSSFWDQWASLGTCFSRSCQRYKRASPVMQVLLLLGHLTFFNIPLPKGHYIAKPKVKDQRNKVYLFSGKNWEVIWQRVWVQEEVKGKNNRVINSVSHREGAYVVASIPGLPRVDVQVYHARWYMAKSRRLESSQHCIAHSHAPCHGAVAFF